MTPPINIDGSTVDAITIDGSSVKEVTVDGSTVFSAIPDSGLTHEWQVGSSGPIADSIGSNDLTVNGGSFNDTAATFRNGFGYDTQGGGGDYASGQSFISDQTFTVVWWVYPRDSSNDQIQFTNGGQFNYWPEIEYFNGNFVARMRDDSGTLYSAELAGGTVNFNELSMLTVRYDDNTLSFVLNDNVTESTNQIGSVTIPSSGDEKPPSVGGRDKGSGFDFLFDGISDWGLWYNRSISDSEITDIYNAHPST